VVSIDASYDNGGAAKGEWMADGSISRGQAILGIVAGAIITLSAGAHSFMGWPAMHARLVATNAPQDLITGLRIGWQFGGVAIAAFGIIALYQFVRWLRGERPSLAASMIVAAAYFGFGVWALVITRFDLFTLIFIIPGALLGLAAIRPPARSR
jgi:hypothetical protein